MGRSVQVYPRLTLPQEKRSLREPPDRPPENSSAQTRRNAGRDLKTQTSLAKGESFEDELELRSSKESQPVRPAILDKWQKVPWRVPADLRYRFPTARCAP